MRTLSIVILSAFLATHSLAYNPKARAGHKYADGRTIAESGSTKHVQGREYVRDDGTSRRRVLIYDKATGDFKGYSKLGREKGDARHRHHAR